MDDHRPQTIFSFPVTFDWERSVFHLALIFCGGHFHAVLSCERFCGFFMEFCGGPFFTVSCTDEGLTPIHQRTLAGGTAVCASSQLISSHLILVVRAWQCKTGGSSFACCLFQHSCVECVSLLTFFCRMHVCDLEC